MIPATRALYAARNTPFGVAWPFTVGGAPIDLTGFTAELQLRLYEGAIGAPLVALGTVTTERQGLLIDAAAGIVEIRIDQATLAALPLSPAELGDPDQPDNAVFAYDLVMIGPAGDRDIWVRGTMTLRSGVSA